MAIGFVYWMTRGRIIQKWGNYINIYGGGVWYSIHYLGIVQLWGFEVAWRGVFAGHSVIGATC